MGTWTAAAPASVSPATRDDDNDDNDSEDDINVGHAMLNFFDVK